MKAAIVRRATRDMNGRPHTIALIQQVEYFLELSKMLYALEEFRGRQVHLNDVADVIRLYGGFADSEHYNDFLNDLKQMESEFRNRFRYVRLNGSSEFLYQ